MTAAELSAGLYGAWRLARGDRAGLDYFDATPEGAWRSFQAAFIALPVVVLFQGVELMNHELITASGPKIIIVTILTFAIDWVAYPLLVLKMAPAMGFDAKVLRFLPALNWARVLSVAALVIATLIGLAVGRNVSVLFSLALTGLVLVYHWFVAKAALEISGGQAAFLVAIDLVLTYLIGIWGLNMLR
ncbi:MAG: hypothetical protein OEM59_17350 [Rhodospirillales bacterium]|nr:hypothetical protein [Rhodospirillales bacterium]